MGLRVGFSEDTNVHFYHSLSLVSSLSLMLFIFFCAFDIFYSLSLIYEHEVVTVTAHLIHKYFVFCQTYYSICC